MNKNCILKKNTVYLNPLQFKVKISRENRKFSTLPRFRKSISKAVCRTLIYLHKFNVRSKRKAQ
jgi:hypothetical protein